MSPALVVVIISLLLGLQPLATDLFLPVLPDLHAELGASMAQAQLTLSALLLAFGCSQLVWGPLSDRFGRRPILLWGMSTYFLAALASAMATSIEFLLATRAVQGVAMGAGVMCARAIVRDLHGVAEGTRVMSKGQTGLGILACLCPMLGGLLTDWLGWRAPLMALAAFGALTLALLIARFKESIRQKNPYALQSVELFKTWRAILGHPTFWACSLLSAASFGGLFTFLATSSFVFIQGLGLTRTQYGLLMFTMPLSYIVGTIMCRILLARLGMRRSVAVAGIVTLLGGTLLGVSVWAEASNSWAIMLPFHLFMVGHGIHQPCGQIGAIAPFPNAAGTASALNGFLMMVVAFAIGGWLGLQGLSGAEQLAQGILFWSLLTALTAWTLIQAHGQTRHP